MPEHEKLPQDQSPETTIPTLLLPEKFIEDAKQVIQNSDPANLAHWLLTPNEYPKPPLYEALNNSAFSQLIQRQTQELQNPNSLGEFYFTLGVHSEQTKQLRKYLNVDAISYLELYIQNLADSRSPAGQSDEQPYQETLFAQIEQRVRHDTLRVCLDIAGLTPVREQLDDLFSLHTST